MANAERVETKAGRTGTAAPELRRRLPRVLVAVALTLPVLLVVGVLLASNILDRNPAPAAGTARLALPAVPVPAAASSDCARLVSGLPAAIDVGGSLLARRVLADPVPAGTVAWGGTGSSDGDRPIVLRCGLPRPAELTPSAALLDVDGVDWVQQPAAPGTSTWVTATPTPR